MTTKKATKRSVTASKTISAYRRLFSTEDGKIVLEDLMKANFIGSPVLGNDVNHTYYNEGARGVILRILHTCNLEETQIERMIFEMNKVDEDMFN